jgi:hypothetical protein
MLGMGYHRKEGNGKNKMRAGVLGKCFKMPALLWTKKNLL